MTFGGVEADLAIVPFEHGAAARARRHDHRRFDLRRDTGARERGCDRLAFLGAIVVRRQVLQRTAAAGAEMRAN
jgi:hypothetical protein